MDLKDKYCLFEDKFDMEIFLTLCEEHGVCWFTGTPPKYYFESDSGLYHGVKNKQQAGKSNNLVVGYFVNTRSVIRPLYGFLNGVDIEIDVEAHGSEKIKFEIF